MAGGTVDEGGESPAYIRFKGVWDMQEIYETVAEWCRMRKYKFRESVYKHKHPSPFGVERQYIWEAKRKENDYVQYQYDIYIHTYDAHDIEAVIPDGSKKVFTKGRIWVEIKGSFLTDWEKRFDERTFYSHLKAFINKYVIFKNFSQGWGPKMRYEMYELQSIIKERLKAESAEFEHQYRGGGVRKF